jgi:flagellar motility protein MotE (MotC chaperone)
MKQHKKRIMYRGLFWVFSVSMIFLVFPGGFSSFCIVDMPSFISTSSALAADDETGPGKKEGEAEPQPCPECPECPDPAKVVLRGLEEKKTRIEKQQAIQLQEKKELELFEEQIDEKLEALKDLKRQIEEDMALLDKKKTLKELEQEAAYEAKIGRLVKMYAGMKPKDAAKIVDKMNLEVAQEIFLRMREASASQILAFVDSEKAAKISERLAFKRK